MYFITGTIVPCFYTLVLSISLPPELCWSSLQIFLWTSKRHYHRRASPGFEGTTQSLTLFRKHLDPSFPKRLLCACLLDALLWNEVPWHFCRVMTRKLIPQLCHFGLITPQSAQLFLLLFFLKRISTLLALPYALKLLDLTEEARSLTPPSVFQTLLVSTPTLGIDFYFEDMMKVLFAGPLYFINLFSTILINSFSNVTNWTL